LRLLANHVENFFESFHLALGFAVMLLERCPRRALRRCDFRRTDPSGGGIYLTPLIRFINQCSCLPYPTVGTF
jgi:hypothetical protein